MLQSCGKNGSAWDRSQSHPSLVSLETSKRNKEASRWEPTANSFFMLSVSGMLITTKHFKEIQGAFAPIGWGRRKTHRCAVHTQPPPPLQSLEHQGTHIWFALCCFRLTRKLCGEKTLQRFLAATSAYLIDSTSTRSWWAWLSPLDVWWTLMNIQPNLKAPSAL